MKRHESGQLKAFADITLVTDLGEITLRGFRVLQQEGKAAWVAPPSINYQRDGEWVNRKILETSRRLRIQMIDAVLGEFNKN